MEMDKDYERKCYELAYLIFPDVDETVDDLEIRYPERNLPEDAKVVSGPDIVTRGFVYVRENEPLIDEIKEVAKKELSKCEEQGVREWSTIKTRVRESLIKYIYSKTKRQPMILPILMDVDMDKKI